MADVEHLKSWLHIEVSPNITRAETFNLKKIDECAGVNYTVLDHWHKGRLNGKNPTSQSQMTISLYNLRHILAILSTTLLLLTI